MFDSWVFDIALERWERRELRGTSVPRVAYHTQHFAPGPGLMFVLFGAFNRLSATNRIYVTNIETMQWQLVRPAGVQPSPRAGASAAAFGMDMVVFGGVSPRNGLNAETWWFYSQDLAWELVDLSSQAETCQESKSSWYDIGTPKVSLDTSRGLRPPYRIGLTPFPPAHTASALPPFQL